MSSEYELQREARIAANQARLAQIVTARLALPAALPASGSRKRIAPDPPPPREKSTRARSTVDYCESDNPRGVSGRTSLGERGQYGTADGTSCHSCRQRTNSVKAECTSCPLKWCKACLRVRYGKDACEVNASGAWTCPKCEGKCICSACRKKSGKAPTIIGPRATAEGYSSVQEYLLANVA